MGLKAYTFKTTIESGHELNMYLIFRTLIVDNDLTTATLIFQAYPSKQERERQSTHGNGASITYNLALAGQEYMNLFTGQIDGILGLEISKIVWNVAKNIPFINDCQLNEDGIRVPIKKTLIDLNAVEVDLA